MNISYLLIKGRPTHLNFMAMHYKMFNLLPYSGLNGFLSWRQWVMHQFF